MRYKSAPWIGAAAILVFGCASKVLHYDHADRLQLNEEYDNKVQVKSLEPSASPSPSSSVALSAVPTSKSVKKKAAAKISVKKGKAKDIINSKGMIVKVMPGPHQPDIEDARGFIGRRPVKDPF